MRGATCRPLRRWQNLATSQEWVPVLGDNHQLGKVSLYVLKRFRKWRNFFKKSSDPYVKVVVGGGISAGFFFHCNISGSGIACESKVHYLDLNPEFKFVCEIPVGGFPWLVLMEIFKVEEPRGQFVKVTVLDRDPVR